MSITRIRMIARRVILQFRNDHRTMGLIFVVPVADMEAPSATAAASGGIVSRQSGAPVASSGPGSDPSGRSNARSTRYVVLGPSSASATAFAFIVKPHAYISGSTSRCP